MASLRFLKARKRWQVRWQAKARNKPCMFKGSRVFIEKSQAIKFYADIEAQERLIRNGKVTSNDSIYDIKQNFFKHITRHTRRTQQHYRSVLTKFINGLPKNIVRIQQLESAHIQDYLYKMSGLKNRTCNAHLTVIKSFCRYYSDRYLIDNPASRIKLLQEEPPVNRFLTKEEYMRIIEMASPMAKNRIIFLANTGLRASEFASLRFEKTGLKSITIIGKGRRRRTIPLNQSAREIFPFVKPASRKALFFQFSKLAKKLNIPSFGPNALRHYFGTQLLLNGVPAAKVAKIMGNSVRVIEMHYAHILTSDIDNVTDILDL